MIRPANPPLHAFLPLSALHTVTAIAPPPLPTRPLLIAEAAWLFVSDLAGLPADLAGLLAATLQRLAVQAGQQRVVVLLVEPALGREYGVRVTPCLVLDTGARQVQLPGDPAQLDVGRLEAALARH